jgi:hypothetical protein
LCCLWIGIKRTENLELRTSNCGLRIYLFRECYLGTRKYALWVSPLATAGGADNPQSQIPNPKFLLPLAAIAHADPLVERLQVIAAGFHLLDVGRVDAVVAQSNQLFDRDMVVTYLFQVLNELGINAVVL